MSDQHTDAHGHQSNGIRSAVNDSASSAYTYAQRSLDRVVAPSDRQRAYDNASAYAHTRPVLFSFLVAQLVFCFLPFLTFAVFSLSTVAFALGAALLFSLFWIGVAFLVLVPTLLVISSIAVLIWAWAVGSFLIAKALYARIPVSVKGEAHMEGPGDRHITVVKEEDGGLHGDARKGS